MYYLTFEIVLTSSVYYTRNFRIQETKDKNKLIFQMTVSLLRWVISFDHISI